MKHHMKKHQSLSKNKLFPLIWHGKGWKYACTFRHEKASVLCRNINDYTKQTVLIWQGKGCKYVLSDMKRLVFYVETSIITQKQTVLTHLAWERPQIGTFGHERLVFYEETSIITQKQIVLTHLAWERPQM